MIDQHIEGMFEKGAREYHGGIPRVNQYLQKQLSVAHFHLIGDLCRFEITASVAKFLQGPEPARGRAREESDSQGI